MLQRQPTNGLSLSNILIRLGDVSLIDAQGCELPVAHRGYDHFS